MTIFLSFLAGVLLTIVCVVVFCIYAVATYDNDSDFLEDDSDFDYDNEVEEIIK